MFIIESNLAYQVYIRQNIKEIYVHYLQEPCPALAMKSRVSSFLTKFHTSQRCGSGEKSDKVRVISHFPPVMNPLSFFTQFHTSQRCESVEQRDRDQGKSVTSSLLCQTIPHFYNFEKSGTWNEKEIGLFQTSTPQKRTKKESRDLVARASAGHL